MTRYALLLSLFVLLLPTRTRACWDGVHAQVGDVELRGDDTAWTEPQVIALAQALGRIDALLPPDATLRIEWGHATLQRDEEQELPWAGESYDGLFDVLAAALGTSPADEAAARRTETPVYAVQVGSFASAARAEERAASLAHAGEHGFVQVGGFPADNATTHVVTSERGLHRVMIGAFLARDEAEAIAAALGDGAFVRRLRD